MTPAFILLTSILSILQISLPKRLAFIPLVIAACHMGNNEIFADLTPCRLLIAIGLVRAVCTGSFKWSIHNKIDLYFLIFTVVAILVSIVPRLDVQSPFKQNIGLAFNVFGSYLYGRSYLSERDSAAIFSRCLAIIIIPLAAFMVNERITQKNSYSILGSRHDLSIVRDGKNRASGPFQHPILAGTLGAVSLPFMMVLWRKERKKALIGIIACIAIAMSSNSSGPLAATMISILCMALWKQRSRISSIHLYTWIIAIILHLISTRGIWYLMARIDLTGGSTGFHRAKLIDNAFKDFDRWWLAGTDYTRNWMFSGVTWSPMHTDITNYYIHLGVIGGVGLPLSLIAIIYSCFIKIGRNLKRSHYTSSDSNIQHWAAGAALFSHSVGMLSISYFDQIYSSFYLLIALISSFYQFSHNATNTTQEGSKSLT